MSEYISCIYCQSKFTYRKFNLCCCNHCGIAFKYPYPAKEDLDLIYKKSWSEPSVHTFATGGMGEHVAKIFCTYLLKELQIKDYSGFKVCEIGAGQGFLLEEMRALKAEVYAVEPYGFELLVKKEIPTYKSLPEIRGNKFDLIIMSEVIEHLLNPWDTISEIKTYLNTNGKLFITTPNVKSLPALLYKEKWKEFLNPTHINFFSNVSLEKILYDLGYLNVKRLKWYIDYNQGITKKYLRYFMQYVGLDSQLKYLVSM